MRSKRVQDRKECIGWMPGHWEGRTLSEAKGHGEIPSVIHGSPIGKPYPSSVASLRSLDFSNLANWNIWVAKGREINRDPVSSGERERIGGLKKNKDVLSEPQQSVHFFFARFHSICCGLDDGKTSKLRLESLPYYLIMKRRKGFFSFYRCWGWVRGWGAWRAKRAALAYSFFSSKLRSNDPLT